MNEKFVILDRFVDGNLSYWMIAKINPERADFSGIGSPENYVTEKVYDDILLKMLHNSPIGQDYRYFKIINDSDSRIDTGNLLLRPREKDLTLQTFRGYGYKCVSPLKLRYILISICRVNNRVILYDRKENKFITDSVKFSFGSLMQLKRSPDSALFFKIPSEKKPIKIYNIDNIWYNGLTFDEDHYLISIRPLDTSVTDCGLNKYVYNSRLLSLIDELNYKNLDDAVKSDDSQKVYNEITSEFMGTYGYFYKRKPYYGKNTIDDVEKTLHPEKYNDEVSDSSSVQVDNNSEKSDNNSETVSNSIQVDNNSEKSDNNSVNNGNTAEPEISTGTTEVAVEKSDNNSINNEDDVGPEISTETTEVATEKSDNNSIKFENTSNSSDTVTEKPVNVLDAKVTGGLEDNTVSDEGEDADDAELNRYYDSNGNCIDFDGLAAYLDKKRAEKLEKERESRKKLMQKPSIEVGIADAFRDVLDENEKRWVCINKNDLYEEMVFSLTERGTIDVPSSLLGYVPYKIIKTMDGASFEFKEVGVDKHGVVQVEEVPINPQYVYLAELYRNNWKKYYLLQVNSEYRNRVKLQCLSDWVERKDDLDLSAFTKKYVQWVGRKEFLRTSDWS